MHLSGKNRIFAGRYIINILKKGAFLSFSSRLTQRIIVVLVLTITIVALFVIYVSTSVQKHMSIGYYLSELQVVNESVERRLQGVEVALVNSVGDISSRTKSPEDVYAALEDELRPNDKRIVGYSACFEPYHFPNKGKWFEPYVYRFDKEYRHMQIGSEKHDYFNLEWYQNALKSKKGYWSDPYFDNVATKIMMCSFFLPMHDSGGRKIGVLGADFSLDWLYKHMRDIDAKINEYTPLFAVPLKDNDKTLWAYSIIIDSQGTFIYHPDKDRILKDNFFETIQESPDKLKDQLSLDLALGKKFYQEITVDGVKSFIFFSRVKKTNWTNAVIIPKKVLMVSNVFIGTFLLVIIFIGLVIAYRVSRFTIYRSTQPLQRLAESADEVAKGNFQAPLPELKHNDEIRLLRDSFSNMQQSLTEYISQLKTTTAQKAVMESELSIAREIQMSMVPTVFPQGSDVEIYASLTPAKAVGGDLYDFYVSDGMLYFCIGDVSGKGVPAALLMTVTRSLFRAYSNRETMPNRIVSQMNRDLSQNNTTCMFVTLFVGILDLRHRQLYYCNAGHEAPLLIDGDITPLIFDPVPPAGVISDTVYQTMVMHLNPGSTLMLFTDGLSEATNGELQLYGKDRIKEELELAKAEHQLSPKSLVERFISSVHEFVGDTEQSDDLTMLCLRIPSNT